MGPCYTTQYNELQPLPNWFSLWREMREEEARLERLHDQYLAEAEKAERQARVAEEEAAR